MSEAVLREIESFLGRRLRVLHIGNVANYAFANARLMRQIGVDADVLDPDSYHIMATPEWYEAFVSGPWGDDHDPDWSRVDLCGYRRPDWFVQGPRRLALAVLTARQAGDSDAEQLARAFLDKARAHRARILHLSPTLRRFWKANSAPVRLARRLVSRLVYGKRPKYNHTPLRASAAPESLPPEVAQVRADPGQLTAVMGHYDIVIGYGLGALLALCAKHPRVVAYDLGTIRGLPFENTELGRLTAWTYRSAHQVFLTNTDCLESARRLGISPDKSHPILHAFDTEACLAGLGRLAGSQAQFTQPFFFAPARHYWTGGSASFRKGNDVIIEAAARLAAQGSVFRLVFVSWGDHVEASRALVQEKGLVDRCTWIEPRSRLQIWPIYAASVAVIDQFSASALGGVGLESLALGCRLISNYDVAAGSALFSEPPPMLQAANAQEVAESMAKCLEDPADEKGIGLQARAWMAREHSIGRQMQEQLEIFRSMLLQAPQ